MTSDLSRDRQTRPAARQGGGSQDGIVKYLSREFNASRGHDSLPLAPADVPGPGQIGTHALVLELGENEQAWYDLHLMFAAGKGDNTNPWFRCIGVARGLGAKCVVVEQYYVCLDYKSEYASFYAHLDAPRAPWSVRLHFFSEPVAADDVPRLGDKQKNSYLGYLVLRQGDLPLVGRCLLKVPSYVDEASDITESVNFFGQRLRVTGVPFMQQDQRFAVCAQAAMWTICYNAYRLGLTERRLIADIVEVSGRLHPLRPGGGDGLDEKQVAEVMNGLGFRSTVYLTPTVEDPAQDLPRISAAELPSDTAHALGVIQPGWTPGPSAAGGPVDASELGLRFSDDMAAYLEETAREQEEKDQESTGPAEETGVDPVAEPIVALHTLIDYLLRPYIHSRWPVYCATYNHALVICGRSDVDGRPVMFVHDDQNGPYLLAETLPALSRASFVYQSGAVTDIDGDTAEQWPPHDRVSDRLPQDGPADLAGLRSRADNDYAVRALVLATPSRVLLPASSANRRARRVMIPVPGLAAGDPDARTSTDAESEALAGHRTRVSIMMGIDYKSARRLDCPETDTAGVTAFASVQLSEWVVVVEGLVEDTDEAAWEFVYDASSSETSPRLQLARILGAVVTSYPRTGNLEATTIATTRFPAIRPPARLGKVADGTATNTGPEGADTNDE